MIKKFIPYNKPFFTPKSLFYITDAVSKKNIASDGFYSKKCCSFFKKRYGFNYSFLTPSCTAALEMTAILLNIEKDDEVIVPSYTFTSTANAFVLRGAKIKFADSSEKNPNIDPAEIEKLITKKTKAVVIVHYAGVSCCMKEIIRITKKYNIALIEDCAQAINSFYLGKPLGSFGDFSCFSFHDTKNISSGEGGLLVINNKKFIKRAEIIREKGTNRSAFFRGEINKYGWIDIGSSFLCSEITAAYLYGQIKSIDSIQKSREKIFNHYYLNLKKSYGNYLNNYYLPHFDHSTKINCHIFYLIVKNKIIRDKLIKYLKLNNIQAISHYISLHSSKFYAKKNNIRLLKNSDKYTSRLIRLPIYPDLQLSEVDKITDLINLFFKSF